MRFLFVPALALLAVGCAANPAPAPIASAEAPMGATRVMVGAPDIVADALISEMTDRQYTLTDRTATTLAFDRPVDNAALWQNLGGSAEALPHARVIMTLTAIGSVTSVTADMVMMTPGADGAARQVADANLTGIDPRIGLILEDASQTVLAETAAPTRMASAAQR